MAMQFYDCHRFLNGEWEAKTKKGHAMTGRMCAFGMCVCMFGKGGCACVCGVAFADVACASK